ncbi:hypothetical protein ANN_23728 [Periplaneta americana]|uniref:Uncharacterized protein n=1 Tax=Periplaneta americana TaxID=6978 RepID=A0ABQ8SN83_PERAM|nr:hypothetical protein ANN_23728 [Periplaneta americana]
MAGLSLRPIEIYCANPRYGMSCMPQIPYAHRPNSMTPSTTGPYSRQNPYIIPASADSPKALLSVRGDLPRVGPPRVPLQKPPNIAELHSTEAGRESVREGSREQKMFLRMCFKRFREGKETIEDEPRSGRPSTSRTPEMIEKVRQMLAQDRRLTLRLIAEELDISKDTVHTIVRDDLGKRKICSRFVPHKLTDEQKAKRMETSRDFISMCDQDPLLLKTIVTGDETWCYQFDPESKRQSMSWCSPTSPRPKKKKSRLQKSKRIRRVRHELHKTGKWMLLHDNAPAHCAICVRQFLAQQMVNVLEHPPYSADLDPAEFVLFPRLKAAMKGERYADVNAIKDRVTTVLRSIPHEAFADSFQKLYERCQKCVVAGGDYFEGQ